MTRRIKLIWDFFGPDAQRTAEHHLRHVVQFLQREGTASIASGAELSTESTLESHWVAFVTVAESDVSALRAALRPHRGLEG